jgi:hypothetical protein
MERGRWGDLWWEALVALLLVCGLAWTGWRAAQPGGAWILPAVSSRWVPVILLVAITGVVIAQSYRGLRRSPAFWGMAAGFLAVFGASAYAWFSVEGTGLRRGVWIVAIAAAEFAPFAYLVHRKFHVLPKKGE